MQALQVAFPGKIGKWVDWYKVEALGSVHKYPKDKQAQEKKHGLTPEQQAAIEKQKADGAGGGEGAARGGEGEASGGAQGEAGARSELVYGHGRQRRAARSQEDQTRRIRPRRAT